MKVQFSDNALTPGPRAAGAASAPAPAAKDFATVLAKASATKDGDTVKKTGEAGRKTADDVKKTRDDVETERKGKADAPARAKAERIKDLPGRSYDEIVAGPRNGMMINDSGNVRDGQAFLRVEREGRTFHIYGSGKDRQIFEVGREPDKKADAPKKTTSQTGATISAV